MGAEAIPFSGQLQEKEYRAVMRTARPAFLKLVPWLLLVVLLGALGVEALRSGHPSPGVELPRAALGLFLVLVLFVAPEMAIRGTWKKNALARQPVSGAVSSKGIRWEGEAAKAKFSWDGLRGYRVGKGLLLLFTAQSQALWLLPRFFETPEDWERARERIIANVPKK